MRIINNIYDEAYKHEIDIDYAVIFTFQELLDIDLTDQFASIQKLKKPAK